MHAATTIRELGPEEIFLVGGAWTWEELFASMSAGAVVGAIAGGTSTMGAGIVPGAISGGLLAGASYMTKEYVEWLIETYWM